MNTTRPDRPPATVPLRDHAQFSPNPEGYLSLLEVLRDAVFTLDTTQRVRFINPAAAELLGVQADEAVGLTCEELMRCATCDPACAVYETRASSCTRRAFPREIRRRDGSEPSLLIDSVPLGRGHVAVLVHDGLGTVLPADRDARLRAALTRTGGCVTRAARLLGVHRTTLWRQMRELGLSREDYLLG